jgi:hypothetical protein
MEVLWRMGFEEASGPDRVESPRQATSIADRHWRGLEAIAE